MAYTPSPLFAGDLHDTAARLAAHLAQNTRGFRTAAAPAEGTEGWRQMLELGWQGVWIAESDGGFGGSFAALASIVEVDLARVDHWVGNGAQPTPAVKKLISIVRERG